MTSHEMTSIESPATKRIALVAHDNMKREMLEWATEHKEELKRHVLIATGSTGKLIADSTGLTLERMRSGPLGGDQQIGARISDGGIDVLLFFGIHLNRNRMTPIFGHCYASPWSGISRWLAIVPVLTLF
ncbi:methylglyoxal synthase [Acidimicrobiaceae bacterium]|nr:methylglyoxal synthase [Acidimicrobiaceae bacterium]